MYHMQITSNQPVLLFKYGGNAMTNKVLKEKVLHNICQLNERGFRVVIVHGGGPFIQELLDRVQVPSEFIHGLRKTTPEALKYVEMALKGQVNGELVGLINRLGYKAVGLSGKDGRTVTATKRYHQHTENGVTTDHDLGQVGDVESVDASLIFTLLDQGYIPVITCIASDGEGHDFNINADIFAGAIAGSLRARSFNVLTDVDGLLEDIQKPDSLLNKLTYADIDRLKSAGVIGGGMIPKIEACQNAINMGSEKAIIINGTKPEQILELQNEDFSVGTTIIKE